MKMRPSLYFTACVVLITCYFAEESEAWWCNHQVKCLYLDCSWNKPQSRCSLDHQCEYQIGGFRGFEWDDLMEDCPDQSVSCSELTDCNYEGCRLTHNNSDATTGLPEYGCHSVDYAPPVAHGDVTSSWTPTAYLLPTRVPTRKHLLRICRLQLLRLLLQCCQYRCRFCLQLFCLGLLLLQEFNGHKTPLPSSKSEFTNISDSSWYYW